MLNFSRRTHTFSLNVPFLVPLLFSAVNNINQEYYITEYKQHVLLSQSVSVLFWFLFCNVLTASLYLSSLVIMCMFIMISLVDTLWLILGLRGFQLDLISLLFCLFHSRFTLICIIINPPVLCRR